MDLDNKNEDFILILQDATPLDYKGSISIHVLFDALQYAQLNEAELLRLLEHAQIQPELLRAEKARLTISQFARFWVALADHLNDEFFAMDQHAMRRGSFSLLSKSLTQYSHLKAALQHSLHFLNLILDDLQGKLLVEEHYAYIVIYDHTPKHGKSKTTFAYATYIMLIHSLMCWLSGQRIPLLQIQLKCAAPIDDNDYKIRFCQQIHYQADENYLQFDANYLNLSIKQDQKSWYAFIRQTPYNLLVRYKNPHSISAQIRKHLLEQAPSDWLELNELAAKMHLSDATMQRRLKHEGLSYQQLKNDIRRDSAIEALTKTNKSLQHISDELNFHDVSAFHRAFKKWVGVSPGSYRLNQQQIS